MRIVKFLATLTLGFTIGEMVNEYRTCKINNPDLTVKEFFGHYLEETKELVDVAGELARRPDITRRQFTAEISEQFIFPKKK